MLPRLRVNRARPPLAESAKISIPRAAVEQQRVDAVLALDHVAAVAGIPLEHVVAGAEERDVVALLAVDEVVAVAAEDEVGAVGAEKGIVARAAVDRHFDECGQIASGTEAVVAAIRVDHEVFARPDVDAERRGIEPVEAHAGTVGGRGEDLRAVAAIDLDGVGTVAAFVQIGVVARVPDHAVVAAFAEHLVVGIAAGQGVVVAAAEQKIEASLAEEGVVAALTEELIVARAAGEGVVAVAAEEVGARQRPVAFVERDRVVPAQAEPLDQAGIGHRGGAALDDHRAAVDENGAGGIAADRDRIVEGVAEYRQQAASGVKGCGDSHCRRPLECSAVRAALAVGVWCAAERIGSVAIGGHAPALEGDV